LFENTPKRIKSEAFYCFYKFFYFAEDIQNGYEFDFKQIETTQL